MIPIEIARAETKKVAYDLDVKQADMLEKTLDARIQESMSKGLFGVNGAVLSPILIKRLEKAGYEVVEFRDSYTVSWEITDEED